LKSSPFQKWSHSAVEEFKATNILNLLTPIGNFCISSIMMIIYPKYLEFAFKYQIADCPATSTLCVLKKTDLLCYL